jgi:TRAP-type C4-dicarboxylate transport system permease small subunit
MSVRKNNHIQVDYFFRLMPRLMARVMSTLVDLVRCVFLGYSTWLNWLLLDRIGSQPMAVIDLPVAKVTSCAFAGPALDELYITTATFGMSEADLDGAPESGNLFVCRPGATGQLATEFG